MLQQVIQYRGEHTPIDTNPSSRGDLLQLMQNLGVKETSIDSTTLWQYSVERNTDSLSLLFFTSPPVFEAVKAERVLFVGTRSDLTNELGELYRTISSSEPATKLNTCTMASNFWARFFDCDNFLDQQTSLTIPKAIISTGKIRNEVRGCNETLDAVARLEEIARNWGIPLKLI